mmetsp:Transcript_47335/g.137895  ORF Transcript_47335/g.137895 Transcript_47335/m.137895 type:complete len:362 (-) Transcript_47335:106-1191(-)
MMLIGLCLTAWFFVIAVLMGSAGGNRASTSTEPKHDALIRWAVECGIEGVDNVYIGGFMKNGVAVRGLGLTRDIAADEPVICSPMRCLPYTTDPEFREIWGKEFADGGPCTRREQLALYLAEEARKGNASKWAAFIRTLPSEEEYRKFHPAYRPIGPPYLPRENDMWRNKATSLQQCYEAYLSKGRSLGVSYDDAFLAFVWAKSRGVTSWEPQLEIYMMPIAELCNASPLKDLNARDFPDEKGGTEYDCTWAIRDLHAGEELLCEYFTEDYNPLTFFQVFGFTLPPENFNFDVDGEGEPAMCDGLRPHEFTEPKPDADPIVRNFWRFASTHCTAVAAEFRRQSLHAIVGDEDVRQNDEEEL